MCRKFMEAVRKETLAAHEVRGVLSKVGEWMAQGDRPEAWIPSTAVLNQSRTHCQSSIGEPTLYACCRYTRNIQS